MTASIAPSPSPLRERREDIPLLVDHFLKKFAQSMNRHITGASAEAMKALCSFDWPGNVRELQNAMERAVPVSKTKDIQPSDLPLHLNGNRVLPAGKSLADVERQHIKSVLEEGGWNIYRAARLLGIDRVTLYNKIKKYGFKRNAEC